MFQPQAELPASVAWHGIGFTSQKSPKESYKDFEFLLHACSLQYTMEMPRRGWSIGLHHRDCWSWKVYKLQSK